MRQIRQGSFIVLALLGWVFLAACTSPVPAPTLAPLPTTTMTSPAEIWQIQFRVSGGIAGIRRVMDIANNGQLTVFDEKASKQIAARVPEKELSEISIALKAMPASLPAGRLPPCPDCFSYDLNGRFGERQISALLNDQNLPASGLEPLIRLLMDLQQRTLDGKLKP